MKLVRNSVFLICACFSISAAQPAKFPYVSESNNCKVLFPDEFRQNIELKGSEATTKVECKVEDDFYYLHITKNKEVFRDPITCGNSAVDAYLRGLGSDPVYRKSFKVKGHRGFETQARFYIDGSWYTSFYKVLCNGKYQYQVIAATSQPEVPKGMKKFVKSFRLLER